MNQIIRSTPHSQTISSRNKIFSIPTGYQGGSIVCGIKTLTSNTASDTVNVKITRKAYNTVFQGYPDVLDVKQVSELLNVSTKTVYRLLRTGSLSSLKVGREFRIPKLYLMQYLKVTSLKTSQ